MKKFIDKNLYAIIITGMWLLAAAMFTIGFALDMAIAKNHSEIERSK